MTMEHRRNDADSRKDLRQLPFFKHVPHTNWPCLKFAVRFQGILNCKGFQITALRICLQKRAGL